MNAISAIFVVVSLVVLGFGWRAINRKAPTTARVPLREREGRPSRR